MADCPKVMLITISLLISIYSSAQQHTQCFASQRELTEEVQNEKAKVLFTYPNGDVIHYYKQLDRNFAFVSITIKEKGLFEGEILCRNIAFIESGYNSFPTETFSIGRLHSNDGEIYPVVIYPLSEWKSKSNSIVGNYKTKDIPNITISNGGKGVIKDIYKDAMLSQMRVGSSTTTGSGASKRTYTNIVGGYTIFMEATCTTPITWSIAGEHLTLRFGASTSTKKLWPDTSSDDTNDATQKRLWKNQVLADRAINEDYRKFEKGIVNPAIEEMKRKIASKGNRYLFARRGDYLVLFDEKGEPFDLGSYWIMKDKDYDYSKVAESDVAQHNGHKYIDLGLPSGAMWADMNIGATSPLDYGITYAQAPEPMLSEGSFDFELSGTKYDWAKMLWGGQWHRPTDNEFKELLDLCDWEWTNYYGIEGFLVTGPNSNTIFLPMIEDENEYSRMEQTLNPLYGGDNNHSFLYWAGGFSHDVSKDDNNKPVLNLRDKFASSECIRPVYTKKLSNSDKTARTDTCNQLFVNKLATAFLEHFRVSSETKSHEQFRESCGNWWDKELRELVREKGNWEMIEPTKKAFINSMDGFFPIIDYKILSVNKISSKDYKVSFAYSSATDNSVLPIYYESSLDISQVGRKIHNVSIGKSKASEYKYTEFEDIIKKIAAQKEELHNLKLGIAEKYSDDQEVVYQFEKVINEFQTSIEPSPISEYIKLSETLEEDIYKAYEFSASADTVYWVKKNNEYIACEKINSKLRRSYVKAIDGTSILITDKGDASSPKWSDVLKIQTEMLRNIELYKSSNILSDKLSKTKSSSGFKSSVTSLIKSHEKVCKRAENISMLEENNKNQKTFVANLEQLCIIDSLISVVNNNEHNILSTKVKSVIQAYTLLRGKEPVNIKELNQEYLDGIISDYQNFANNQEILILKIAGMVELMNSSIGITSDKAVSSKCREMQKQKEKEICNIGINNGSFKDLLKTIDDFCRAQEQINEYLAAVEKFELSNIEIGKSSKWSKLKKSWASIIKQTSLEYIDYETSMGQITRLCKIQEKIFNIVNSQYSKEFDNTFLGVTDVKHLDDLLISQ